MPDQVEVRTKLTVDAAASESVLGGLRKQFELTSSARAATQAGMGFFGNTMSMMAGMYLPQVIHKTYEWGESFVDAARNEGKFRTAISALAATTQNLPWEEAAAQAKEFSDSIDKIAISSDTTTEDIREAFKVMTEIGGGSFENMEKSIDAIDSMASISRVLGISASSVAREYEMMGEGILRTRGQLFQLLHTTGIFGKDVHHAAAGWAKLTETQRTERLTIGMDKLSEKMKLAPEGFGAIIQKMNTMEEIAKAQLGTPLLQAIVPQLTRVMNWMRASRGSIEEFAKHMADDVAKYAEEAGRVVREGWEYVTQHWQEINHGVKEAWSYAERVIQFAVEHKEALAIAVGAKMVLGSAPVQGAIGVGKAVYGMGAGAAAAGGGTLGVAGGAAALGAFSLAVVGVGLAAWQATKLMNDLDNNQRADVRARYEYFQSMSKNAKSDFGAWDSAAQAHFEYTRKKFTDEANLLGMSKGEAEQMADAVKEQHDANRKMVEFAEDAARRYQDIATQQGGMVDVKEQNDMIGVITKQFAAAQEASNTGAQQYIANLLGRSKELQQAFLQSADMTSEGYKMLSEMTQSSAGDFSEALKRLADAAAKKEKTTAKVPSVQFNGGQTFKIQQDFRDENPDRIAVVFQRDILAAAERRYQSSYASPFGS